MKSVKTLARIFCGVAVAIFVMTIPMKAAGAGTKAAPEPKPAAMPHANTGNHFPHLNPHLHGAEGVVDKKQKTPQSEVAHQALEHEHPGFLHLPWRNRWNLVTWRTAHLRYGEVRGVVESPSGTPAHNAHVWLQHPNGHPFARRPLKHATDTNAQGEFIMRHVLAGDYKLNTFGRGPYAKTGDHTPIAVRAGTVDAVRLSLK